MDSDIKVFPTFSARTYEEYDRMDKRSAPPPLPDEFRDPDALKNIKIPKVALRCTGAINKWAPDYVEPPEPTPAPTVVERPDIPCEEEPQESAVREASPPPQLPGSKPSWESDGYGSFSPLRDDPAELHDEVQPNSVEGEEAPTGRCDLARKERRKLGVKRRRKSSPGKEKEKARNEKKKETRNLNKLNGSYNGKK